MSLIRERIAACLTRGQPHGTGPRGGSAARSYAPRARMYEIRETVGGVCRRSVVFLTREGRP